MHDHTLGPMISKITESQKEHCRIDCYLTKIMFLGERGMFLSFENIPRALLICEINHAINTPAPPKAIQLCCSGYLRRHRAFQMTLGYMAFCKFCEIMSIGNV